MVRDQVTLPVKSDETFLPSKKEKLAAFFRRVGLKGGVLQLALVIILAFFLRWVIDNTVLNLTRLHIASGFDFLNMRAGISIPDSLIPYTEDSDYRTALLAGLINTIFMSVLCIAVASVLGLMIAFGRLSRNWLLRTLCLVYVETFRNLPPLLVILFWYFGVLQQILPSVQQSFELPFNIYINQRGIYFPAWHWRGDWFTPAMAVLCGMIAAAVIFFRIFRRKKSTGRVGNVMFFRFLLPILFLLLPAVIWLFSQSGWFDIPQRQRFNIIGGANISPEFLALFLALSLYTAALISETVRAGIEGVDTGLKEAGEALGLHAGLIARFITLPLALRIIIPPLASQYMNLVKNTSLAVAIGYSDLMRVGNTVLNQTNQSIEVVLIWLLAYLGLSLLVSVFMNWFNHRAALVER